MAKIATYPVDAVPTLDDKVIGTDVDNELITKNYRIGDIVALVPGGGGGGITSVDGATGPAIDLAGKGGITITAVGNLINIDGSGIGGGGITSIDGATGPAIDLAGKGGITITAVGNLINIDGSGISGGNPGAPQDGIQVNDNGVFVAYDWLKVNQSLNTLDLGDGSIGKGGTIAGVANFFNGQGDEGNVKGSARFYDFTSNTNYVGIVGPERIEKTSYEIALPSDAPSLAGQVMSFKANQNLTYEMEWTTPSGGGGVSGVSGTAPVNVTTGTTPVVSMAVATDKVDGYLSSTDYNTFNSKQDALVSGTSIKTINNQTLLGTGNITISSGGTPGGSDGQIQFNDNSNFQGDTNLNWDTTNNILVVGKETNPTLTEGVIHLKGNGSTEGGKVKFQTGAGKGSPVDIILQAPAAGAAQTISLPDTVPTADTQILGIKSISGTTVQTQWETPSGGGGGTVTGVSGTAPIVSSGGTTPDISMAAATDVADGYLTSADYNTFFGKQGAITLTTTGSTGAATLIGNTLNIPQYTGGSTSPGGSSSQIQYNNNGSFDGDAKFTLFPSSTLTTVTIGNSTSPSVSYGLLKLTGNGSSEGGKIQLETGAGKGSPVLVTLQAPASGAAQTISLPDTVPTADTQILGIKSISGSVVQTQWETPSGGGGAVTSVTTTGSTGAATLNGGVLNIPNYTFGNGISFIGSQKTIATQQIPNNTLTLISFGTDTVFKNSDPDFGTVQTESNSQGIRASEISFSGAESEGNYWIVMNVNFESQSDTTPIMYAEVEGSPSSQKLVEMTTELLTINGSENKHNYYKCFRYTKVGADKQTVHLQVYFPAKDGGRGQTIAIPSPVSGMAQAPSASVDIWKN